MPGNDQASRFTFPVLIESILDTHAQLKHQAARAVNMSLTLRNWLIGMYIEDYARQGVDRAEYGETLMDRLSEKLKGLGVPRTDRRSLFYYRAFYLTYPQIVATVSPQLRESLQIVTKQPDEIVATVSPLFAFSGKELLEKLSFSHFLGLLTIDDPQKRSFYEVECIKGVWSVRELQRQIASLLYERTNLSEDKARLLEAARTATGTEATALTIRDPYVFEFVGLRSREVMGESDLEDALLDKLQDFLLELGRGFCFEARQKRILIGDSHGFVDLVFYHRILKCHVLVELKIDQFSHQHLGQLNTYVSWFRQHEMTPGDNPPVGLLLCTQKDGPLVEYALAGMDNNLFVSRYRLQLPDKTEIERFLAKELERG